MKPTYNPSKVKRARRFGFRKRASSSTGKLIFSRRRAKGRKKISVK